MTTLFRKLLVLAMVTVVLVLASIYEIVRWLTHLGIPEMAGRVSDRFLGGTTIAIIVVLILLLRSERPRRRRDDDWGDPPQWDYGPPRYRRRRPWW